MIKLSNEFFKQNSINFISALLAGIINTGCIVYTSFLLMDFTNIAITGNQDELHAILYRFFIFLIFYMGSKGCSLYFKNAFIRKGILQYKSRAFTLVMKKHIASFQKESTSAYISAFTNDSMSIEQNYLEGMFEASIQLLLFLGALISMAYLHLGLTILIICTLLLPLIISMLFGKTITEAEQKTSVTNAHFTNKVKDFLSGFTIIKSFQSELEFSESFNQETSLLEQQKYRKRNFLAIVEVMADGSSLLVNLVIFGVGAFLSIEGEITAGTLIAFVQLSNFVIAPLQVLPALISNVIASKALIHKMESCCNEEDKHELLVKKSFVNSLKMKDVTFQYDEDVPVLKNINLTFEKGKSYAIVGGSGCGKSTLLQLLLGYHTGSGDIEIDGIPISHIDNISKYDLFSLIQQTVFLFDDSLEHNITMFKHFSQECLQYAIHKAELSNLINDKGFPYLCGENGNRLSGGEKQRISIARSLLKESPILLMDEGTSSLDASNAFQIEHAILSIQDKTKIIVTHRLQEEILRRYDEIIVLNDHTVVEKGTFQQLYDTKGYFYSLYQIQN